MSVVLIAGCGWMCGAFWALRNLDSDPFWDPGPHPRASVAIVVFLMWSLVLYVEVRCWLIVWRARQIAITVMRQGERDAIAEIRKHTNEAIARLGK